MLCGKRQGSDSDPNGSDTCQEDIRAIEVRREAQFASQTTEPQNHMPRPRVSDMIHKQRCNQDYDEDTTHALHGLHTHVFDIQPIFLIKAIGMFNLRTMAPLGVDSFGIMGGMDWYVGDQNQSAVQLGFIGNQGPQYLFPGMRILSQPSPISATRTLRA